jgi:two-component system, chemotaxis family, chemotaxis protein CheY
MNANTFLVEVIEDESVMRRELADALQEAGFSVVEAITGEEGLSAALAKRPDVILLDLLLPGLDGLSVLRKLREHPWGQTAPVIVLSNFSDLAKVSEAMENGAFQYVVKSDTSVAAIVHMVKEHARRKGLVRQ